MIDLLNGSYFDRLDQVQQAIAARLERAQAVLVRSDDFEATLAPAGVNYGCQATCDVQIATLKGRPTRKYAHATVDRCASGRYELTFYIL